MNLFRVVSKRRDSDAIVAKLGRFYGAGGWCDGRYAVLREGLWIDASHFSKKIRGASNFLLHRREMSVSNEITTHSHVPMALVVMQRRNASFLAEPVEWAGPEREVDMVAKRRRAAAPWPDDTPRMIRVARGSGGRASNEPSSLS
jgi:hypothetical protein